MRNKHNIWVVVADGAHARFLAPDENLHGLQPAGPVELKATEEGHHSRDLKSDRPGRTFGSSGTGVRHTIEPKHDYHKMEKHKFTAEIAEVLDHAALRNEFDSLILVAPSRSLGEFRELVSKHVKDRLKHEVHKDLIKTPLHELWEMVEPAVKSILVQI